MVFHGHRLVCLGSKVGFSWLQVGFSWLEVVFHGCSSVFHGSRSDFMVPCRFFMVPGGFHGFSGFQFFSWFQVNFLLVYKVPAWFFMVPGRFLLELKSRKGGKRREKLDLVMQLAFWQTCQNAIKCHEMISVHPMLNM